MERIFRFSLASFLVFSTLFGFFSFSYATEDFGGINSTTNDEATSASEDARRILEAGDNPESSTTGNLETSTTGNTGSGGRFLNPLEPGGVNDLPTLIGKILDVVVRLGAYVAVLFLIWSGFLFVQAQGNQEAISKAKTTFLYTVIGVAILLGAKAIEIALRGTINSVLGT